MIRHIEPGDRVRVASKTAYEPLARAMRARQPAEGFLVETICETRKQFEREIPYTVQVRYDDGSLSGALYADIFEIITE